MPEWLQVINVVALAALLIGVLVYSYHEGLKEGRRRSGQD